MYKNAVLVVLSVFLCITLLCYWTTSTFRPVTVLDLSYYYFLRTNVSQTVGCQIPRLDPYDPSIRSYIRRPDPAVKCKRLQPNYVYFDDGFLHLNRTELQAHGYDVEGLACKFRCIEATLLEDKAQYGPWTVVHNGSAEVPCEAVHVQCSSTKFSFVPAYDYMHLHVPRVDQRSNSTVTNDQPNVILLVVDSMSRSNFIRQMPQTYEYLTKNLSAVDFKGMVKVADNSFPNAVAYLTGRRPWSDEVPKQTAAFDEWPLIFFNYSQRGYTTYYNEDMPEYHLFNYYAGGFRKQPTNYYSRAYWLALWDTVLHHRSTPYCYGNMPKHVIQWNHLLDFFRTVNGPKFAFSFTVEISHEWLNTAGAADSDLKSLLVNLRPYLKRNTFLFLFGDHGHRFDSIRQTMIGRYEERMPFVSLTVPEYFQNRYGDSLMKNLRTNSERLLSFYDLHATLVEILQQSYANTNSYKPNLEQVFHGTSLFRSIPTGRTCDDVLVPSEFCVCQQQVDLPTNDSQVEHAANALLQHINQQYILPFPKQCALLALDSIVNAQLTLPSRDVVGDPRGRYEGKLASHLTLEFVLTILVIPSGALFEAKVLHNTFENRYNVIGDVNRINRYGNQSNCIEDFVARKFCYCLSNL